jgi:hypothetical protein
MVPVDYLIGLDLGQVRDHSALAVLERVRKPHPNGGGRLVGHYAVRHLRRWPLHTSYTTVAEDLIQLVRRPPLRWPVLVVDQTGVGQAVVDVLARRPLAAALERVVITGGRQTTRVATGAWHVPKGQLVACLRALLASGRLKVAALPERAQLVRELSAFRARITEAAQETFAAAREQDHDDLLLAVALVAWWGERHGGAAGPPTPEGRTNIQ